MTARIPPHARNREELAYLLGIAAELEHGLACVYMFTAFSLKSDSAEGGIDDRARDVCGRWKKALLGVAVDEMLHLAQVANLLAAIGLTPHMLRPNFPQPASAYPLGVPLELLPFSRATLERFVRYELPQRRTPGDARPSATPHDGIEPFAFPFRTIGELYDAILALLESIPEPVLFVGPRRAQADGDDVRFGRDLVEVVDHATARAAVGRIVARGEAPSTEDPDAHYGVFQRMLQEYDAEAQRCAASNVPFDPVRPVTANPVTRRRHDGAGGSTIAHPVTHEVAELANFAYQTLLLVLGRYFATPGQTREESARLASLALDLMANVVSPLGETLARMPFAEGGPAQAGCSFAVSRDAQILPLPECVVPLVTERLAHLAEHADRIAAENGNDPWRADFERAHAAIARLGAPPAA